MRGCSSRCGSSGIALFVLTVAAASIARAADCNRNGVEDAVDIEATSSLDCNADGIPDECQLVGHFTLNSVVAIGARPHGATAGDVDADGDLDIITADGPANTVSVLFNNGDGTLSGPRKSPSPGTRVEAITSADLDGDGDLDLATAATDLNQIVVLWGAGDGTFPETAALDVGLRPVFVTSADLDGDERPDLVSANEHAGSVTLLFHQQDGLFGHRVDHTVGNGPRAVAAADLEGDGDIDLVVANRNTRNLSVLLNVADGALSADVPLDVPGQAEWVTAADLNGDGRLDLVNAGGLLRKLGVFLQREDGTFPAAAEVLLGDERPSFVDAADLDSDGTIDLVTANTHSNTISIIFGRGDGTFGEARHYPVGELPLSVLLLDLDADGDLDLLSTDHDSEQLSILTNAGNARDFDGDFVDPTCGDDAEDSDKDPPNSAEKPGEDPAPEDPTSTPATPTFELVVPEGTTACGTFQLAGVDRGARQEYELKSRIRFRGGTILLKSESETFATNLFTEVLFGPAQERAAAQGTGLFRVTRLRTPDDANVTVYRFTYTQDFTLAGGRTLRLELVRPLEYDARGDDPVTARQTLDEAFFVAFPGREAFQASVDGVTIVRYGSCAYETLDRHTIEADFADGTSLRLAERWVEPENLLDTGPAIVERAEVTLGERREVITDYWRLVYSAFRHNTEVTYWVVLEPPARLPHVAGDIYTIELAAPEELRRPDPRAAYLGRNFEVLSTPLVTAFRRDQEDDVPAIRFRRGDAAGDGELDVTDPLALLGYLFRKGKAPACRSAADANDDGRLNVTDAVNLLTQLFDSRVQLPAPFPDCGEDPTPDELSCEESSTCP